jgi:hypothetical protein
MLAIARLHRRACHRPERTEHTAIPRLRPQHHPAVLALIEPLAGVGRHRLRRLEPSGGASECRFKKNGCFTHRDSLPSSTQRRRSGRQRSAHGSGAGADAPGVHVPAVRQRQPSRAVAVTRQMAAAPSSNGRSGAANRAMPVSHAEPMPNEANSSGNARHRLPASPDILKPFFRCAQRIQSVGAGFARADSRRENRPESPCDSTLHHLKELTENVIGQPSQLSFR